MAYLGAFRYLHSLNLADCYRINSSALWAITGMPCLKKLDVSRCSKVTDAGIRHLLSITTLEELFLSETGVTTNGVTLLSSLPKISVLDMGGLPVTDLALCSLQALTKLQHLDLWGSQISDEGAIILKNFPTLSILSLAWTRVTMLPNLSSLVCLNLSNCTIHSLLEGEGDKAPLAKLMLSGSSFSDSSKAFLDVELSSLSSLDLSNSTVNRFDFLHRMTALEYLDLSGCWIEDDSVEQIACVGEKLKYLNLSKTKVSSAGVASLVGHVPDLETFFLSCTATDDLAILYLSMMPSLKCIDLKSTNIKGTEPDSTVQSLVALQNLSSLECLDLEGTHLVDDVLQPLSTFPRLSHISLRSNSLTDMSLCHLSPIKNLTKLVIGDAVLTNDGLDSFDPPPALEVLDLTGCWLLTEDVISSFCKKHPQIELKHELAPDPSSDKDGPSYLSSTQVTQRISKPRLKQGKQSTSEFRSYTNFLDQRLKYTREELLALQFSSAPFNGKTGIRI